MQWTAGRRLCGSWRSTTGGTTRFKICASGATSRAKGSLCSGSATPRNLSASVPRASKSHWEQLRDQANMPCIVHWNQQHFVVVYKIARKRGKWRVYVSDPASGLLEYSEEQFLKAWIQSRELPNRPQQGTSSLASADFPAGFTNGKGIALLLEPTPAFYREKGDEDKRLKLGYLLQYLRPYKNYLAQLALAMLTASVLSLILPFLTQSVVDKGIGTGNLSFVVMMLVAQVVLVLGQMANNLIRSWLMLHMTTRISISLISDFLAKLMRLPIAFFDSKMVGDIMQRIGDYDRIQSFLTGSLLSMAMAVVSFVIYGAVMGGYDPTILGIFLLGSALYAGWILLFMKRRRKLDYMRFQEAAANQSNIVQLIDGMQEIKLNDCEKQKRWEWERIQARLFQVSIKGLVLGQTQEVGRHVHRPDQERRHLVSGRFGRHRGPHDPRHDGRPAIHHRPAQRAAVAVHPVRAGDAGCEDLARTPLGDSGERGRRAGRRGAHPRDSRPCRHRIPGRNVPVRRSALGQSSGRRVGNDSGGQGYGHRWGERLGQDHDAQADAGLLHADLGRGAAPRPPHRAVQPVVLAAGVRHGDAGGIRLFGYHSR